MSDPAGARTQDPIIKSDVLYQLSYGVNIFIFNFQEPFGDHDGIRTHTSFNTTPSRWRVYQFLHMAIENEKAKLLFGFGDPAGARTQDPIIKSDVLYQLSYGVNNFINMLFYQYFVTPLGLEPRTPSLKVMCSTN